MSWAIGFDEQWNRDIGYGVPCLCDFPGCNEEIDRGLAYVCGGEPYGGMFCGLFFCDKHRSYARLSESKRHVAVCTRCYHNRQPFKPKPDVEAWVNHKQTHPSWAEWRAKQAEVVA